MNGHDVVLVALLAVVATALAFVLWGFWPGLVVGLVLVLGGVIVALLWLLSSSMSWPGWP